MTTTVAGQVCVIFLLVGIGFVFRKRGLITHELQSGISRLILTLALPCVILSCLETPYRPEYLRDTLIILAASAIYYTVMIPSTMLLRRALGLETGTGRMFTNLVVFPNLGFIGFPVTAIFVPGIGFYYATLFNIAYNLVFFSFGVSSMSGSKRVDWRSIINVNIVISAIMLVLFFCRVQLPFVLRQSVSLLAGTCSPLSLLVIGAMLAELPLREMFRDKLLYLVSAMRLLIIPTLAAVALKLAGVTGNVAVVCLIMSAMPCGTLTAIVAEQHDCNAQLASKGVVQSTLFMMATMPYLAWLFRFF